MNKTLSMPRKYFITRAIMILFICTFAGLGAYLVKGSHAATLTGDLNGDGTVNIFDLSIFLSHWQQTGTGISEDFNNDGTVNIFDLSILLTNYGQTSGGGAAPINQVAPYFCGSISPVVAANTDAIGGCAVLTQEAIVGQTLSVGTGVWSPEPTAYTYQWKDCATTSGQPPTTASCTNVASGGNSSTYIVQATDVGKALVPIVTAYNGGTASTPTTIAGSCDVGSTVGGTAVSNTTSYTDPREAAGCSPISAVVGTTTGTGTGAMRFCTNAPVTCGFPDPLSGNAGVPPGTTLTTVGSVNCGSGQTVSNVFTTSITVSGTCTLQNVRVIGGIDMNNCTGCHFTRIEDAGAYANQSNVTLGTGRIENVSSHCNYSFSNGTSGDANMFGTPDRANGQAAVTASGMYLHCGSEPYNGGVGATNSYIISDECYGPSGCYNTDTTHNEAIYQFGGDDAGTAAIPKLFTDNTIIMPWGQTAGIYQDCTAFGGGPTAYTHIDGNLFATYGNNGAVNACPDTTGFEYLNNRMSFTFGADAACGIFSRHTGLGNVQDESLVDLGTLSC